MHRMVAVLDHETSVDAVVAAVTALGIERSEIGVLSGEEGEAQLDARGEHHGPFGRLLRLLQMTTEEGDALQFHQQALAEGKRVIYVTARGQSQKDEVAAALTGAGGHHLAYFGRWTVEREQG